MEGTETQAVNGDEHAKEAAQVIEKVADQESNMQQSSQEEIVNKVLGQLKPQIDKLKTIAPEDVDKKVSGALDEYRKSLVRAISGEEETPEETENDRLLAEIVDNPKGFQQKIASQIRQQISSEQAAYQKVFGSRLDIQKSKQAQSLVLGFYGSTDARMSEADRYQAAVDAYDAFLEQQGMGSSQERLAKISSVSGGSSGQVEATKTVSEKEVNNEYIESRLARAARLRGR